MTPLCQPGAVSDVVCLTCCRLATAGPLTRAVPGPVLFRMPPLKGRCSHAFRAAFRLAGFGRLAVLPFIGVPLRGFGQFDAPLLRARQYTVSPVALLQVRALLVAKAVLKVLADVLRPSSVLQCGQHSSDFEHHWMACVIDDCD